MDNESIETPAPAQHTLGNVRDDVERAGLDRAGAGGARGNEPGADGATMGTSGDSREQDR